MSDLPESLPRAPSAATRQQSKERLAADFAEARKPALVRLLEALRRR